VVTHKVRDEPMPIVDVRAGAKPALLQPQTRKTGRPSNEAVQAALGAMAACADMLMAAGSPRAEAGRFVAVEAKRQRIVIRGKAMTPGGVLRVRDEIGGGRATHLAQSMYAAQTAQLPSLRGGGPTALPCAEDTVREILRAVRGMGF
jgi:hypothetical protein